MTIRKANTNKTAKKKHMYAVMFPSEELTALLNMREVGLNTVNMMKTDSDTCKDPDTGGRANLFLHHGVY
jgi:hypothetical protein